MKSVLISIRPKWCKKIVNGQKTIEVRKTRPKLELPFKCYIYQTMGDGVIGEFVCDAITRVNICGFWNDSGKQLENRLKGTCMTAEEFCNYLGIQVGYGWHIADLRIYDTPRELREFTGLRQTKFGAEPMPITRPPQSWCYVEEQTWND